MSKVCIAGGNGFIGHHLARRLKKDGHHVTVVDIKSYEYGEVDYANIDIRGDLRDYRFCESLFKNEYDYIFQLACFMGGCQFIFVGDNDSDIMHNSALINLNVINCLQKNKFKGRIFFSSSACIYPDYLQKEPYNIGLKESDAYPASPDSDYGIEKLFSERLYLASNRNYGIDARIARYHNIYGSESTYYGGKEKAPASISKKVAEAALENKSEVGMWGDGEQSRSFLFIDDAIDATLLLMESNYKHPINIGSEEGIKIKDLWKMAVDISGEDISIISIERPTRTLGVMGRNSDNTIIEKELGWKPKYSLREGMEKTYNWIYGQVRQKFGSKI